jgi:hypothetical protein
MAITPKHFSPSRQWREKVPTKSKEEAAWQDELKGLIFPNLVPDRENPLSFEEKKKIFQTALHGISIKDEDELDRRITELALSVQESEENKGFFRTWISGTYQKTYGGKRLPEESVERAVKLCEKVATAAEKHSSEYFDDGKTPKYLVDPTNQDIYLNESPIVVRGKGFLLTVGTVLQLCRCPYLLAKRALGALTGEAKDVLLFFLTIPLAIALLFAALYTIIDPYNGRKFYASLERLLLSETVSKGERAYLAPCFQPRNLGQLKKAHLFGGPESRKNAF